jgi:hypothetical protein
MGTLSLPSAWYLDIYINRLNPFYPDNKSPTGFLVPDNKFWLQCCKPEHHFAAVAEIFENDIIVNKTVISLLLFN